MSDNAKRENATPPALDDDLKLEFPLVDEPGAFILPDGRVLNSKGEWQMPVGGPAGRTERREPQELVH